MKSLPLVIGAIAVITGVAAATAAKRPAAKPAPQTFAIETYVARTYNYLDRMVDAQGMPYFDVFWTDPAEAAHDFARHRRRDGPAVAGGHHGPAPHRQTGPQREALGPQVALLPRPQDRAGGAAQNVVPRLGDRRRRAGDHPLRPGDGLRREQGPGGAGGDCQDARPPARRRQPHRPAAGLQPQEPDGLRAAAGLEGRAGPRRRAGQGDL